MGKTLLWFEHGAAVLLVLATISSFIARIRRPMIRRLVYLLVCLPGLVCYGTLTAYTAIWRFESHAAHFPFYYVASLSLVYLVTVIGIAGLGMRVGKSPDGPLAAHWPSGKLAVAALVAIVMQAATFSNLDLAAKERITRLKMEGAAMAQSVAPTRPAAADNAGPLYVQALRVLNFESQDWVKEQQGTAGWNDDLKANDPRCRPYLAARSAELQALRRAAKMPRCYFEREYGRPSISILLPETQDLRSAARVLSLDARVAAADHDAKRASEDIAAIYGLARHVTEEPFLVSGLIAAAFQQTAARTLADVLGRSTFTEDQLAAFQVPDDMSLRRILRRCLIFEEAMLVGGSIEFLADPVPGDESAGGFEPNVKLLNAPGGGVPRRSWQSEIGSLPLAPQVRFLLPLYRVFVLPNDVYALQSLFERARSCSVPPAAETPQWFQGTRKLTQEFDKEVSSGRDGLLTRLVWPAVSTGFRAFQRADSRTDVARVVLAAAHYRARKGEYPPSLEALVPSFIPAIPVDPFDGKSLKLRIDAKGWTVYCTNETNDAEAIELTLPMTAKK